MPSITQLQWRFHVPTADDKAWQQLPYSPFPKSVNHCDRVPLASLWKIIPMHSEHRRGTGKTIGWCRNHDDGHGHGHGHDDNDDDGGVQVQFDKLAPDLAMGDLAHRLIPWQQLSVGETVGAGSYAEVLKGRWQGETVAIKRLNLEALTKEMGAEGAEEAFDDVRQEIRLLR